MVMISAETIYAAMQDVVNHERFIRELPPVAWLSYEEHDEWRGLNYAEKEAAEALQRVEAEYASALEQARQRADLAGNACREFRHRHRGKCALMAVEL